MGFALTAEFQAGSTGENRTKSSAPGGKMKVELRFSQRTAGLLIITLLTLSAGTWVFSQTNARSGQRPNPSAQRGGKPLMTRDPVIMHGAALIDEGRKIFRDDTFGDEIF